MRQLENLDGLRGIAALGVYFVHASYLSVSPVEVDINAGQSFVMLFFLLSAFLISSLYLNEPFSQAKARTYVLARLSRIVPLYFVTLVVMVVVSNFYYQDNCFAFDEPRRIFGSFLFVSAPCFYWTVPVEIQFYTIILLTWPLYHRVNFLFWCATVVMLASVPGLVVNSIFSTEIKTVFWYVHIFLLGILASRMYKVRVKLAQVQKYIDGFVWAIMICFLVDAGLGYSDQEILVQTDFYTRNWGDPLKIFLAFGFFLAAVFASPQKAFLASPVLRWLGKISFGVYLLHYPVLVLIGSFVESETLGFVLSTVGVLFLSSLSYAYFELPLKSWVFRKLL